MTQILHQHLCVIFFSVQIVVLHKDDQCLNCNMILICKMMYLWCSYDNNYVGYNTFSVP